MLLICSSFVAAQQKTIDKVTFEKLVDYCNCKYTEAYIESFRTDPKERLNMDKYDENIKSKFSACTLEKSLSFEDLSKLLKDNGWSGTESKLSSKFNEKKKQIEEGIETNAAIILLTGDVYSSKLATTTKSLQSELQQYAGRPNPPMDGPGTCVNVLTKKVDELSMELQKFKEQSNSSAWRNWWSLVIHILIAGLVILILFVWWNLFGKKQIEDLICNSDRIKEKFALKSDLPSGSTSDVGMFENKLQQIERNMGEVKKRVNGLEKKMDDTTPATNIYTETKNTSNTQSPSSDIKYLRTPNEDGCFTKVFDNKDSNCYYKLYDIKANKAMFEFCGDATRAIANKNAVFDNATKVVGGDYNRAKSIETVKQGEVILIEKNIWKVTAKAEIKFV
ncbi:hypothetical protein EZS27_025312 [termite gut metagenome]|uniref:Uncharacterized protein n=1 Tax=termite gut metagenome TaxID=433724 RepID=A0A5J4QX54_9ZZZZ